MRVAAVQFKADKADKDGSLARLVALAWEAGEGSDLVVLPEMAATGYLYDSPADVGRVAEPHDGPTAQALAAVARGRGCWIVAGFPERDGGLFYNSALVIDPSGATVFVYRKNLLYEADLPWATPGDSGYRSFDAPFGRFGVGICMDLNDDRFIAWCVAEDLDAIAFPTNWVYDESDITWDYWCTRVFPTAATLVAANTWGWERDVRFTGKSLILRGQDGLAAGPREGDGVIRAVVARGGDAARQLLPSTGCCGPAN